MIKIKNKLNKQTPQFRLKSKQLPLKKGAVLKLNGFTLVELLIVMSIMAILTVVITASFRTVQMKSRDTRRKSDLEMIAKALNMYYNDIGNFPKVDDDYEIDMNGLMNNGDKFYISNGGKEVVYMIKVPRETSLGVRNYRYVVSDSGKSFKLFANLENKDDQSCLTENECMINGVSYLNGNIGCCYGISSSNITIGGDLL